MMRWQMGLKSLGLYPNGAKTGVIDKDKYLYDAMVSINAEIEKIDHGLNNCVQGDPKETPPTHELTEAIEGLSSAHRTLEVGLDVGIELRGDYTRSSEEPESIHGGNIGTATSMNFPARRNPETSDHGRYCEDRQSLD